jgi:hypothetical protein
MNKQKENTEYIGARVDPELKKRFEGAATKDNRSISSALVVAMKDYIDKIKKGS